MKDYNRAFPLIVIHIPKAAGVSVKEVFKRWFPDRLHEHYFDEQSGTPPAQLALASLHTIDRPVAVYGHFNRLRGFGVEHYYPEVRQFITIFRDPFELAISSYYFIRRSGATWKDQTRVPKSDLRDYLQKTPPNMLNHFPRPVTRENYRALLDEFFIEIGTVEHLAESLSRIAAKLSKPFDPLWLPHLNETPRDQPYPRELRTEYAERYPLEFEVYGYVRAQLEQQAASVVAQQSFLGEAPLREGSPEPKR